MMDDGNGHNEIPEESFRDGNMVNDPNSGKTPNPKDFKISAIVSFETIAIGVNANCSGMDIILGSFQWGTENKGFDGAGSFGDKDVKVSLPAANRALKKIFNNYSVYKVW